jgi:hypothetical protein
MGDMKLSPLVAAAAAAAALLSGCATASDTPTAARSSGASSPSAAAPLLARYGLQDMDAAAIVDHLDRLGLKQRPSDLKASVRPTELQLTWGKEEYAQPLPSDRFYLSVAPYLDKTHECFYHSLTTCKGELGGKSVRVRVTDSTDGSVLVDEERTTYADGFVGFWLPRDIHGTVEVTYAGHRGRVAFATDDAAPTCLTTLRLT